VVAFVVIIVVLWDKWRKKAIIEVGKSLGLHHLMEGEKLSYALVPLMNKDSKFFVILLGYLNGYEAAYFDRVIAAGKDWFYQSTVMVKNPRVNIPMFQLKSRLYMMQNITQRTCGDALDVPGRKNDMGSLRLSAQDPQWAMERFSGANPQFFQKLQKGHWTIEGFQNSLFIYSWGRTIYPRKMRDFVREAGEIATEMYALL